MSLMRLVNGLPTTIQPYDQIIQYSSGLAANTPLTLPSSGTYSSSIAADLLVIVNGQVKEITTDFLTVGSAPYTQIQFNYALPNATTVQFKQVIG